MTKRDRLEIKRIQLRLEDADATAARIASLYRYYLGTDAVWEAIGTEAMTRALRRLEEFAARSAK